MRGFNQRPTNVFGRRLLLCYLKISKLFRAAQVTSCILNFQLELTALINIPKYCPAGLSCAHEDKSVGEMIRF